MKPHSVLAGGHERASWLYALLSNSRDFDVSVTRLSAGDSEVAAGVVIATASVFHC